MKHCILVKWNVPAAEADAWTDDIAAIFRKTEAIPGVHGARLVPGLNRGGNRYDLMIELTMDADSLPAYDACDAHREWKATYGSFIAEKAIFDHE